MNHELRQRLMRITRRLRWRRMSMTLTAIWIGLTLFVGLLLWLNHQGQLDVVSLRLPWLIVLASGIISFFAVWWLHRFPSELSRVVDSLEHEFPELDSSLRTAVELQPMGTKALGYLQHDVIRRAINHSFFERWESLVPAWQLCIGSLTSGLALVGLLGSLWGLSIQARLFSSRGTRLFSDVAVDQNIFELSVEPGDTEIERGKSLLVMARFAAAIPPESVLVYVAGNGDSTRLPMNKSLDDPVFGGRVPLIDQPIRYWVEYAQQQSEQFEVTVFEFPKMIRADATLRFPAYTRLAEKQLTDIRRVSAVEGTDIEFLIYLNKSIASAVLVPTKNAPAVLPRLSSDGASTETAPVVEQLPLVLQPDKVDPRKWTGRLTMLESAKFELRLVDTEGRENQTPPQFALNVLKNQLPDLKITLPARDVDVSAIEELQLAATAWDDFGIKLLGVNFSIAGKASRELVLLTDGEGKQKHEIDHLLELETLAAQPDELLSYYFWAEDLGPDGEPRRVKGDMFFAEVRHFDEIFRQGQAPPAGEQPPGQPGQSGQQAQQLAELQKQIINATWKLIRREVRANESETFSSDVQLLIDSQQDALEQVEDLAAEINDATSQSYVETATSLMREALEQLDNARQRESAELLQPALGSEQSAYQTMLKLRAREHDVVQSQQQSGQQGQQANSRAQQQMEQLNLKSDENRYETERAATDETEPVAQQEDRQVLNRLRELARRQEDINEQIKELQSALVSAETPAEKSEIERRLKSLRDQQEEMLRDTDELIDRMQQPENQQRMAEETKSLEQSRENLRDATESLEEGAVSQAAAEGTRAQRELETLRDEFRNRSAGQFTEQMRELRDEVQNLENREQKIADRMNAEDQALPIDRTTPSLRTDSDATDVAQQLDDQQESVEKLRDRLQQTIQEAELLEPLLAEKLYETYRESELARPDQALESARESFQRGWMDDAQSQERIARKGIAEMRTGIEVAAESVLGDETESLRAAENALQDLNDQLQQEMKRSQVGEADRSEDRTEQAQNAGQNETESTESSAGQDQSDANRSVDRSIPSEMRSNSAAQSANSDQPDGDEPVDVARNRSQPNPSGNSNREQGGVLSGGGNQQILEPIAGDDFRQWSDRLRDVEEMIEDPELRSAAARIRDSAREMRRENQRHSAAPNWELVRLKVAQPLTELRDRVAQELIRRTSRDARVPLDRDPVPTQYQDSVRKYYERIGSGQ